VREESKAGKALQRIAMRLNGNPELPIENPMIKKTFWKKLGSKFSRNN